MAGADEMKVATEEGKLLTGLLGVLGIFSLLRTFTDFEVTTCMMLSVPVLWIVLAFWFWFKIKVPLLNSEWVNCGHIYHL